MTHRKKCVRELWYENECIENVQDFSAQRDNVRDGERFDFYIEQSTFSRRRRVSSREFGESIVFL